MRRILLTLLILLLGATWSIAEQREERSAAPAADPRFEFLEGLVGTWIGTGGGEELPDGTFEFRLTAGGTAIEEREMVGTPMEMVTLYHMDGKDLVATHYCMLGNQPHVTAAKRVVDDTLVFSCSGKPGNTRSHDDEHIHGWTMRLDGDGRLHYEAKLFKQGQLTEASTFVLTRQ